MSDIQEIKVPALGESVTEATIARWLKKEGDQVAQDEPLVELETDKVTLEVMAPATGKIEKIIVAAGQTVEVGAILGSINGAASNGAASAQTSTAASLEPATSAAPPSAEAKKDKSSNMTTSQPASGPAARKMMDENNLSANDITGSAKDGRISKGDVTAALSEPKQSASPAPSAPSAPSNTSNASGRLEERVPMTRLRQRIAQRLKEAQNTAAILTTFNEVDMTAINAIRATYKDSFAKKYDIKLGFMSFFIKATIQALKEIPAVNAQIDGTDIVYKNYCDIGVAISAPQGLIVPIIRDAQNLNFADIERIIVEFGEKAKNNKLSIEELSGGTFSISNGGTFGSLMSTPILNPPQSAILGMHKIQDRAMVIDGKIEIRPMMYLALSYDHRLIDGREAVTFLKRIKECIEAPERLLFDV